MISLLKTSPIFSKKYLNNDVKRNVIFLQFLCMPWTKRVAKKFLITLLVNVNEFTGVFYACSLCIGSEPTSLNG